MALIVLIERERKLMQKVKKSIDDKIKPILLALAWLQSLAMVK